MNFWLIHRYMEYFLRRNDKMDGVAIWEFSLLKTNSHQASDIPDNDYRSNYDVSICSISVQQVFSHPTLQQKTIHLKSSFLGVVPVRIQRQFYSPFGEFYCFAVLLCFAQCYSLREF